MNNFPSKEEQEKWISLALNCAKKGIGNVSPNPLVGAVIIKNGKLIGQGVHLKFGEAHAEVNAINQAGDACEDADLYVTLEPCSHHGKTSPCVDLIIEKKIARVFIGMVDCNPKVAGQGIKKLKSKGIKVKSGILKEQCEALNQPFIKLMQKKESFLFLKAAITLDGKIATASGHSKWITNKVSRKRVDYYRSLYSAILCGANTLRLDNPSLKIRDKEFHNRQEPYRLFVCHSLNKINKNLNVVQNAKDLKTIFFVPESVKNSESYKQLHSYGVRFEFFNDNNLEIEELLKRSAQIGIDSIILEGGSSLISQALKKNKVDQGEIFIAPIILGDNNAIPICSNFSPKKISEGIKLKNIKINQYDDNSSFSFTNHFYKSEEN